MKLFQQPLACLWATTLVATSLLSMPANAQTKADCAWMYGIDNDNNIIEYNPELKVVRQVLATGLTPRAPAQANGPCNAFAFDSKRSRMFFIYQNTSANTATDTYDADNGLYYWDSGAPSVVKIGELSELFLTSAMSNPANAVFSNDAYYFIKVRENKLVTCPITAVPDVAGCTEKDITMPATGFLATQLIFGDTVIDKAGTTMYGATTQGFFFKVTGLDSTPVLEVIKPAVAPFASTNPLNNPSVQLAYDALYDTLYATRYQEGEWFTVDTATGNFTGPIPGYSTANTAPNFFGARDLGGSSCAPVPNADSCNTTYAPLQTTFSATGWGIKKNRGSVKPGQPVKLTTKLYNNKRVAGVEALDSVRVYTFVPVGLTVRKIKPEPTASVPTTRPSGEGTTYWWDLSLGVGKRTKITVWTMVDKPYGPGSAPLIFTGTVWPDYPNVDVCTQTAKVTINVGAREEWWVDSLSRSAPCRFLTPTHTHPHTHRCVILRLPSTTNNRSKPHALLRLRTTLSYRDERGTSTRCHDCVHSR